MRVVFDRPLYASPVLNFTKQCAVTMGRYVTAGERFESFRPGYQVVKIQRTMPRFELPVETVRVALDKRSADIETAPRPEAVNCAITLPGNLAKSSQDVDLLADATGVEATW